MREFAGFAEEAEVAIDKEDFSLLADLMEKVRSKDFARGNQFIVKIQCAISEFLPASQIVRGRVHREGKSPDDRDRSKVWGGVQIPRYTN